MPAALPRRHTASGTHVAHIAVEPRHPLCLYATDSLSTCCTPRPRRHMAAPCPAHLLQALLGLRVLQLDGADAAQVVQVAAVLLPAAELVRLLRLAAELLRLSRHTRKPSVGEVDVTVRQVGQVREVHRVAACYSPSHKSTGCTRAKARRCQVIACRQACGNPPQGCMITSALGSQPMRCFMQRPPQPVHESRGRPAGEH